MINFVDIPLNVCMFISILSGVVQSASPNNNIAGTSILLSGLKIQKNQKIKDISLIAAEETLIAGFDLPYDPEERNERSGMDAFKLLDFSDTFPVVDSSKIPRVDDKLKVCADTFTYYSVEVLLFFKYHIDVFMILNSLTEMNLRSLSNHSQVAKIEGCLLIFQSNYIFHYLPYKKDLFRYLHDYIEIITEGIGAIEPLNNFISTIHAAYIKLVHRLLQTAEANKTVMINNELFKPNKLISEFNKLRDLHSLQIYTIILLIFDLQINQRKEMKMILRPWFLSYISTDPDVNSKNARIREIMSLGEMMKNGLKCLFEETKDIEKQNKDEVYQYLIENAQHLEHKVLEIANIIFFVK